LASCSACFTTSNSSWPRPFPDGLLRHLLVALLEVLIEADEHLRVLPEQLRILDLVERDHALFNLPLTRQ
jgi:hypothetical protein